MILGASFFVKFSKHNQTGNFSGILKTFHPGTLFSHMLIAKSCIVGLISFRKKGIYCDQGGFYIDPWQKVDKAVITHAHADHARWGMNHYLCHDQTKPLIKSRIGNNTNVESLPYGKSININGVKVSLHPSAHIIGAAQIRMEYKGFVSVVSGDYKRQDDGISTPFEVVKCNEFVTESTFGLPIYKWMPLPKIESDIRNWVAKNKEQNKTSVFIAYSLGKSQRLMQLLKDSSDLFVHPSITKLNEALLQAGVPIPDAKTWTVDTDKKQLQGQVLIVPPALLQSKMIRKVPSASTAICSGWMKIRGNRRWQSADAGFAVSDHADWTGLLQTIKDTEATKIFVTHGYSDTFSRYLKEKGYDASIVETQFGDEEGQTETGQNIENQ